MRGSSTRFMRAPTMLVVVCSSTWVVMASPHRRRVDGLDDVLVAGAAAEVALEPAPDLRVGQPLAVRAEELDAGHDHPRRAEAALERVALPEGLLQRMELALAGEKYSNLAGYTDYRLPLSPGRCCPVPGSRGYASPVAIATSYDGRVKFGSVEEVERALAAESYLPDRGLATAIYLAVTMQRPLLLEGEAGVGKTEVGKTLARVLGAELIRLQCYEGIDSAQALYEWDYARQLLYARALQAGGGRGHLAGVFGAGVLLGRAPPPPPRGGAAPPP